MKKPATKAQTLKVLFRAERRKAGQVTAVMVRQPGSLTAPLCVWDSQTGHGSGSWAWYYATRPAKPAEYRADLAKLRRQYAPEYRIKVVSRYTREDVNALYAQF